MPRPSTIPTHHSHPRSPRAFTLVEIMVVVAVIAILAGILISVGSSVKINAARRSTQATLKTLEGIMADYLKDGNPEPQPPTANWTTLYGNTPSPPFAQTSDTTFLAPQAALATCSSDPINWVKYLLANPLYSKKIASLPQANDFVSGMTGYPTPPAGRIISTTILDAWGTPIRYVPYNANTKKEGYFLSAGPDRTFSNENVSPPPPNPLPFDDLASTDP